MLEARCITINLRLALSIILIFFLIGVKQSQTALNSMETSTKVEHHKNNTIDHIPVNFSKNQTTFCPTDFDCKDLEFPCIRCSYNLNCYYGRNENISCEVLPNVSCRGDRSMQKTMNCRYCYQTELWQYTCVQKGGCNSVNDNDYYKTNCTVHDNVFCLGNRTFLKRIKCNWTHGYKWSTALIISLTLGGFGADRFYLGHWQEGIGKLFSFGGLGVWTIIDVLLISLHYLGPADGSLYI